VTAHRTDLEQLLATLRAQAALPLSRARSLPPELYWRPEVWALEIERIFRREWFCVARVDQLASPGDWIAAEIAGEPLVVTRDRTGALHALSRICRHRNMDLLYGAAARSGHGNQLQCPYHRWAYDLDGKLRGAPMMDGSEAFEPAACSLPAFPLAVWHGFVFVSLDPEAAPLAPRLRPIECILGQIDMSGWRIAGSVPWGEAPVNWKIAFENFAEFYHHIGVHHATLQPLWPAARVSFDASDNDELIVGRMNVNPDVATGWEDGYPIQPIALPPISGLTPEQRSQTVVYGVFPLFGLVVGPESAIWFEWTATGPELHRTDIHVVVPPESLTAPGFETRLQGLLHGARVVQDEDGAANAGVQASAKSPHATRGPLAPIEGTLLQFQRYLARRLCD
jgi:phenylpropionate dioxygenase-like ring-hydroxylating dioxygenase large terminal subunit